MGDYKQFLLMRGIRKLIVIERTTQRPGDIELVAGGRAVRNNEVSL